MELCYDGALVLPSSYAVMDEEESILHNRSNRQPVPKQLKTIYMKAHDPVSERIKYQIVVSSVRKIHLYDTFHAIFVQPFNETPKLIGGI